MSRRALRGPAAVLVAGAVALGAAACTPAEPDLVTTLQWPTAPPAGPLEDDPAVQAVRAFETTYAAAWNARDFTGSAVSEAMTSQLAADGARTLGEWIDAGEAAPYPSPRPLSPVSVEPGAAAGQFLVIACATVVIPTEPRQFDDIAARHYEVVTGDDGQLRVAGGGAQSTTDCEGVEPPVAVFDPAPDAAPWAELTSDDVRGP